MPLIVHHESLIITPVLVSYLFTEHHRVAFFISCQGAVGLL